jgi:hypothetical protein
LLTEEIDDIVVDRGDDKRELEEENPTEVLDEVSPDDVWGVNVEDGLLTPATAVLVWGDALLVEFWLVLLLSEVLMTLVTADTVEDPEAELVGLLLFVVP